jgi:hypothetical protein
MCGYRIAGDAPLTSILMKLGLWSVSLVKETQYPEKHTDIP